MKKVLRVIGVLLLLVIAVLLVAGLVSPKDISVERSTIIDAPQRVVFEEMTRYRNWEHWITWGKRDATMKAEFTGTDGEVGSTYHWKGEESGEGRITTTERTTTEIKYDMVFIDFDTKSDGYIRVIDTAGKSKAIWGFNTHYNFPMNGIMGLMGMKKYLEKDFDEGLANLKAYVESGKVKAPVAEYKPEIKPVDFAAHTYAAIRKKVQWSELDSFFHNSYSMLNNEAGTRISGAPSAIVYEWNDANQTADIAAAFPIKDGKPVKGATIISIPAAKGYVGTHLGNPATTDKTHAAMDKYLKANGASYKTVIEEYVTGPINEKDTTLWSTNIYYLP